MKKKLVLVLVLVAVVFAFTACGGNGDSKQGEESDVVVLKVGASTVPPCGDP